MSLHFSVASGRCQRSIILVASSHVGIGSRGTQNFRHCSRADGAQVMMGQSTGANVEVILFGALLSFVERVRVSEMLAMLGRE